MKLARRINFMLVVVVNMQQYVLKNSIWFVPCCYAGYLYRLIVRIPEQSAIASRKLSIY